VDDSDRLVIGILYPADYEARPRAELDDDLRRLRELDPRIELVDVRYIESHELRTRRGADPTADYRHLTPELTDAQREAFTRVQVVVALDLPYDVASLAPHLRWVQGMGAGVSQLTSAGLGDAGIRLTTAAGVNAVAISEFVIGRLLQIWKRLPEIDDYQRRRSWTPAFGREVAGLTLGLVGLGAINRGVAQRARAFGMRVVACRRTYVAGSLDPDVDELCGPAGLRGMVGHCDAVVVAVPESPGTVGLFDAELFAAMRPGALFCNVGRGSAVDEDALAGALRSGHLGAAAIDVAHEEPLPIESPLWDVPNLYISAHSATSPEHFWANLHELFRENVRRYVTGQPLKNEVDSGTGLTPAMA
jgi:phosphoglycerate dehydrogenase-like enzyme